MQKTTQHDWRSAWLELLKLVFTLDLLHCGPADLRGSACWLQIMLWVWLSVGLFVFVPKLDHLSLGRGFCGIVFPSPDSLSTSARAYSLLRLSLPGTSQGCLSFSFLFAFYLMCCQKPCDPGITFGPPTEILQELHKLTQNLISLSSVVPHRGWRILHHWPLLADLSSSLDVLPHIALPVCGEEWVTICGSVKLLYAKSYHTQIQFAHVALVTQPYWHLRLRFLTPVIHFFFFLNSGVPTDVLACTTLTSGSLKPKSAI